jgi:hypothetical protein
MLDALVLTGVVAEVEFELAELMPVEERFAADFEALPGGSHPGYRKWIWPTAQGAAAAVEGQLNRSGAVELTVIVVEPWPPEMFEPSVDV